VARVIGEVSNRGSENRGNLRDEDFDLFGKFDGETGKRLVKLSFVELF
jgi:hypothetical protein